MEGLDTGDLDTSELKDASSELTDAMGKILDGTGDLKNGLDKLASGAAMQPDLPEDPGFLP